MFPLALLLMHSAQAQALPPLGSSLSVEAGIVGAPDSCEAFTMGLRYGYQYEKPFNPERPGDGGLFARPTLGLRTMPCQGYAAMAGSKLGIRGGAVHFGMDLQVGVTTIPQWHRDGQLGAWGNTSIGPFMDVVIGPVVVGVGAGIMAGHIDQGWVELNSHVGVRF